MRKLFIDFNNLAIRTLFADAKHDHVSDGFKFHKHLVFSTLFANIKKFEPEEVILAVDDVRNWRKKIYPEYKANRKLARDASDFDWKAYYAHITEYIEELKTLPFKVICVPYAEADDVIGVLSKYFSNDENIIVTSDKDYIQLLQHKQNKLYDPIKKKFIEDKNPHLTLQVKLLTGDKGDNVPPVKERMGEKTAQKILTHDKLGELLQDESIKKNYNRNASLISFDYIPSTLQKEIITQYDLNKINEQPVDYFQWMVKHRLRQISENASQIIPVLNSLRMGKSKSGIEHLF